MTTPVPAGFPDFGRTFSEAQTLEVSAPSGSASSTVHYPVRYVGNAKALFCWFVPNTLGQKVQFSWWTDGTATTGLDASAVEALPGDAVRQPIPILGPYVSIDVIPAVGGAFTYALEIWRIPKMARLAGSLNAMNLWAVDNQPITAGATIASDSLEVLEGPATWSVAVGGSVFTAKVLAVHYNGSTELLDYVNGAGPFLTPRPLWLPPAHIRCTVRNDSASNQTYTLTGTRRHNI